MNKRETIEIYVEWYKTKFNCDVVLFDTINVKSIGNIKYVNIILTIAKYFENDKDRFIEYLEFVFTNWSNTTGHGATIKYFPNWIASPAVLSQFEDHAKTLKIKNKFNNQHATYSEHEYIGVSDDVPLAMDANGKGTIYRDTSARPAY